MIVLYIKWCGKTELRSCKQTIRIYIRMCINLFPSTWAYTIKSKTKREKKAQTTGKNNKIRYLKLRICKVGNEFYILLSNTLTKQKEKNIYIQSLTLKNEDCLSEVPVK